MWTPEVSREVRGATMRWLHVLAVEVRFDGEKPVITTIEPDWKALSGYLGQTGAVIRIHASAAKTEWNPKAVQAVQTLLDATWQRFSAAGVTLEEIQLDYDCPEARLADYTRLLRVLRTKWSDLLKVTALPAWLEHAETRKLLALSPGYVLQVHSLRLPRHGGQFTLMDEAEARSAVARAVEIGVPFRVALPTYSCVIVFDEKGVVKDVHGEDLPAGLSLSGEKHAVLDADAYAISALVADWRRNVPDLLRSVIWYRLPVPTDRLNWPVETFEKVVRGDSLKRGWSVKLEARHEGHHEVILLQNGDAPDDLPRDLEITHVEAADGLRGYLVQGQPSGTIQLHLARPSRFGRIRPGERIVAGWVRTTGQAEVKILR